MVATDQSYRPLSGLHAWGDNYRRGNVDAIKRSIRAFGYNAALRVKAGTVYAGNHAYKALVEMRDAGEPIPRHVVADPSGDWLVRCVSIDHLTDPECIAFAIADNRTQELGENDVEALCLLMGEVELAGIDPEVIGYSDGDLAELLETMSADDADETASSDDPNYARTVVAPIYEPKGDCPAVADLTCQDKYRSLVQEIEASTSLDPAVKEFLRAAAARHIVFDYQQIAEFYAHAEPQIQRLMENSALVIIDFDRAIENGFVSLVSELAEASDADAATGEVDEF